MKQKTSMEGISEKDATQRIESEQLTYAGEKTQSNYESERVNMRQWVVEHSPEGATHYSEGMPRRVTSNDEISYPRGHLYSTSVKYYKEDTGCTPPETLKRVLVGHHSIGIEESADQKYFEQSYRSLAILSWESNPLKFIAEARAGRYDTVISSLIWKDRSYDPDTPRDLEYAILEAVRDTAKSVLALDCVGESCYKEGYLEKALKHGATGIVKKHCSREEFVHAVYCSGGSASD